MPVSVSKLAIMEVHTLHTHTHTPQNPLKHYMQKEPKTTEQAEAKEPNMFYKTTSEIKLQSV